MGFLVASPTLAPEDLTKLGVRDHPHTSALVERICKNPPADETIAAAWFALMAGLVTGASLFTIGFAQHILISNVEFTPSQLQTLSQSLIVPVHSDAGGKSATRYLAPRQCYFRSKADPSQQLHSKLFTFVDFGLKANQFLSACGTKREPTVEEVACILLADPQRFWESAGGRDKCVHQTIYHICVADE